MVLPYAAYLRVYEPLPTFPPALRYRWSAYAASPDRPRRARALAAEQAEALRRLIALPPVPAPEGESSHAYVRWSGGVTYICPWQTRLRSWLALARLRETAPSLARSAFPAGRAESAAREFARWQSRESALRIYIQVSNWTVPFAWFVPFAADERWLVLGSPGDRGDAARATAAGTRALVYATTMSCARERVARTLGVIRRARGVRTGFLAEGGRAVRAGLKEIGSWLEEFHPDSLVELDYGGLVHLLADDALCADQSVAEVSAAITAHTAGEAEFAAAMFQRFAIRWRALESLQGAS